MTHDATTQRGLTAGLPPDGPAGVQRVVTLCALDDLLAFVD